MSLVPSETESVVDLVGVGRLVGRTAYCEEPRGIIEAVPVVGGTKNVDVAAVLALAPDLVLANKEENGRREIEALREAGVTVHVSFPCTLDDVASYLAALGALLGVDPAERVAAIAPWARASARAPSHPRPRTFVPIWDDPLMTFDERTYGSAVLSALGLCNAFEGRPRRYPLAADLGHAAPAAIHRVGDRDTRYPRTSPAEVAERRPDRVWLPDEPHPYAASDRARFAGLAAHVACVSGKDLFWYGTRTADACARLGRLLADEPS